MFSDFDTQRQVEEWLDAHPGVLILPDDLMPAILGALEGVRYGLTAEGMRALKALELTA